MPAGTHKGERIAGIGEWIMSRAHIPIPEYEDYVHRFNPTRFDPDEWVRIAADAGMKYMIITSSAVLATAIGGVGEGGGVGGRSGLSSLPEPQQRLADRVAGHPIPASAPQHLTSVNRHHDRAAGSFRSHRVESVS
ncbi:MAG: hypothetical protein AUH42_03990 [Gemmatimonadetes bacterium 13_1_40CM_70_11]|nr:MAG: hypothetical protein AUH42_03990 [Gemmatimonadetes bacterium 13_1_40CM_70_11]